MNKISLKFSRLFGKSERNLARDSLEEIEENIFESDSVKSDEKIKLSRGRKDKSSEKTNNHTRDHDKEKNNKNKKCHVEFGGNGLHVDRGRAKRAGNGSLGPRLQHQQSEKEAKRRWKMLKNAIIAISYKSMEEEEETPYSGERRLSFLGQQYPDQSMHLWSIETSCQPMSDEESTQSTPTSDPSTSNNLSLSFRVPTLDLGPGDEAAGLSVDPSASRHLTLSLKVPSFYPSPVDEFTEEEDDLQEENRSGGKNSDTEQQIDPEGQNKDEDTKSKDSSFQPSSNTEDVEGHGPPEVNPEDENVVVHEEPRTEGLPKMINQENVESEGTQNDSTS